MAGTKERWCGFCATGEGRTSVACIPPVVSTALQRQPLIRTILLILPYAAPH